MVIVDERVVLMVVELLVLMDDFVTVDWEVRESDRGGGSGSWIFNLSSREMFLVSISVVEDVLSEIELVEVLVVVVELLVVVGGDIDT